MTRDEIIKIGQNGYVETADMGYSYDPHVGDEWEWTSWARATQWKCEGPRAPIALEKTPVDGWVIADDEAVD
jgi:hypothetical protein